MNQKTSPSGKQGKVSASRGFQTTVKKPRSEIRGDVVAFTNGKGNNLIGSEGAGVADHSNHRPKEAESLDLVTKKAVFKGNVGRCDPVKRNFNPSHESKVKLLSSQESKKLLASQSTRRPVFVTIKKKPVLVKAAMKKDSNAHKATQHRDERRSNQLGVVPVKQQNRVSVNAAVQKKFSNDALRPRENTHKATQHRDQRGLIPVVQQNRVPKGRVNAAVKNHPIQAPRRVEQEPADQDDDHVVAAPEPNGQEGEVRNADYDPTAREKVLEVLRFFKQVYKRLEREKEARRGGDLFQAANRIDIKTLDVIENMGKKVNVEKRIGSVPGIEVGDEFQYKTQLLAVGLHSRPMCGIDYMKVGDMNLATSIVASERYGYKNKFDSGVVVYTGEGGNVISTEGRTHDQKLTKGNLALANSLRQKKEVRVIRGEERRDRRGKRYIYFGLYMVDKYWAEKEDRGKTVYKFKLLRIPGQPPLT